MEQFLRAMIAEQERRAQRTTEWTYDEAEAERYMPVLVNYLADVFPEPLIRQTVIHFMAALMSGFHHGPKALVLVDYDSHNISRFAYLMLLFFSNQAKYDSEYFNRSTEVDMNDLDGKRLLIVSNVRAERLNLRLLERFLRPANGIWRSWWSSASASFSTTLSEAIELETKLLLTCQPGDLPKLRQLSDKTKRELIVVPMRRNESYYCYGGDYDDDQDRDTAERRPIPVLLSHELPKWRSALMRLFAEEHRVGSGLNDFVAASLPMELIRLSNELLNGR